MKADKKTSIAQLLRVLRPAPESWVKAAREIPTEQIVQSFVTPKEWRSPKATFSDRQRRTGMKTQTIVGLALALALALMTAPASATVGNQADLLASCSGEMGSLANTYYAGGYYDNNDEYVPGYEPDYGPIECGDTFATDDLTGLVVAHDPSPDFTGIITAEITGRSEGSDIGPILVRGDYVDGRLVNGYSALYLVLGIGDWMLHVDAGDRTGTQASGGSGPWCATLTGYCGEWSVPPRLPGTPGTPGTEVGSGTGTFGASVWKD
jgi:hypothetical protein